MQKEFYGSAHRNILRLAIRKFQASYAINIKKIVSYF